jgi:8-oxo-dGTP pyrophosphatase MutT (NUDIX family)
MHFCNNDLRYLIAANLAKFCRNSLSQDNLLRAAVAITVVDYQGLGRISGLRPVTNNGAALILTRRSIQLRNHAGQWALPGGRVDTGESPEQTALRELSEEVGLSLPSSNILGYLDDFITRSGFHITPVIIWGGDNVELIPNLDEVASIHRIPCDELLRDDAPVLNQTNDSERPILLMPVGDSFIATPTAAILYQFREVALTGHTTRVAHYEQPHFAWK